MAEEQVHTAETQADGGHHAEPTLLGVGAEGWVYTGVAIFIVLAVVVFKAPSLIAKALDDRIAAAERTATAELKAEVAAQVTKAAAAIIAARADKDLQTRLTDEAIAGLDRRLH